MTAPQLAVVGVPTAADDLAGYHTLVVGARSTAAGDSAEVPDAAGLPGALAAARWLGVDLAAHLSRAGAAGSAGEVTSIPVVGAGTTVRTVLVVGVGDGSPPSLRQAGTAAARAGARGDRVLSWLPLAGPAATSFLLGYALASYDMPRFSTAGEPHPTVRLDLATRRNHDLTEAVRRVAVVASAVHLARDLANTPANLKSPRWLADQAVATGGRAGLTVTVWDQTQLQAGGFGGLLAVGRGSARPPRLVQMHYRPPGRRRARAHVVLVGKGIVFDSGGISIKAAAGMESMKTDMAGAAAVLATMAALRELDVQVAVTGLLAVAENLPGDDALRPSDVIKPFGGRRSVEITNTDAEGRLVLADALAYADLVLKADAVIDIATLTGAAGVALGRLDAPLFVNDEPLADAVHRASAATGERVWRMPLVQDYRPALDSGIADLVNGVTDRAVGAGSITAALFLREFTGGRPWAHLDIAGAGRADSSSGELSRGATGFGVRLLLHLLQHWGR